MPDAIEHPAMEFKNVREFVDILKARQKNLTRFRNESTNSKLKQNYAERIDEVNHFIHLIKNSNLTVKDKAGNDTHLDKPTNTNKKTRKPRSPKDPLPASMFLPQKPKLTVGREPTSGSKKSQILLYIRDHHKATAKEICDALGFEQASVSAHISALNAQKLVRKGDGSYWEAIVSQSSLSANKEI